MERTNLLEEAGPSWEQYPGGEHVWCLSGQKQERLAGGCTGDLEGHQLYLTMNTTNKKKKKLKKKPWNKKKWITHELK